VPIPLIALVAAGVAVGTAVVVVIADSGFRPIDAKKRLQAMPALVAKRQLPPRAKRPHPGIKVWGSVRENAWWVASYQKSLGCKTFRWGVCAKQFFDDMEAKARAEGATGAKAVATAKDVLMWAFRTVAPEVTAVAVWIVKNFCLRFRFPLRAYEDIDGNLGWAILDNVSEGRTLEGAAPSHPFPARKGWKRVWISWQRPNRQRSDAVVSIFWPGIDNDGKPVLKELAAEATIRGMLRMDPDFTGALNIKQLAGAACNNKKAKFRVPARPGKAKAEYA
jgi:hypothetical protein